MTIKKEELPRGCQREVQKYNACLSEKSKEACFNEKISIMEVCPEHILSALKEKKKWYLRAQVIDNATYRRAMTVSPYNKGRSVSDLTLKTWKDGNRFNLRPDSYWNDDRYDPTVYRHPFKYDNINFPDIEYKDIFGGNWGATAMAEKEKHALSFWSGKSKAMTENRKAQTAPTSKEGR